MPIPADLVKVDMVFTLGDSTGVQDSAEFGVYGRLAPTPPDPGSWAAALTAIAKEAANGWSTRQSNEHYGNGVGLLHARVAQLDTAGHTVQEALYLPDTPWTGASSPNTLPWSISCSVGLYTYQPGAFQPHGARKRGRVYLPPLNTGVIINAKSGQMSITPAQELRDGLGTWLTHTQVAPDLAPGQTWIPGVLSRVDGQIRDVTWLRVDTKLDTQRRREKQQIALVDSVAWG